MKNERQNVIKEIINDQIIRTQDDLANALLLRGFRVTQATVSRDIKDMHLVKIPSEDGGYRYSVGEKESVGISDRLTRILSESVVHIDSAGNLIVIQTLSGSAHVAGEAIDNLKWHDIMGTIAGDNTILVIVRSAEAVPEILKSFQALIK